MFQVSMFEIKKKSISKKKISIFFNVLFNLQTRGSMPFYWSQRPNLKYKPKPIISKTTNHVRADVAFFLISDWCENLLLTS